jgi:hypothetical protein
MTDQHPITPPPELFEQWEAETAHTTKDETWHVAVQAAQWGADQELQACVNFVYDNELCDPDFYNNLRAARRPKPPSLKEQALALVSHDFSDQPCLSKEGYAIIRRALEALPND